MSHKPEVPSEAEVQKAYALMQSGVSLSVSALVCFAQWTRFDPRLGELWLTALDRQWRSMAPVEVRRENLTQASPAALGVLLDQYKNFLCPRDDKRLFQFWSSTALEGVLPANHENYFIGVQGFANQRVREDAEWPIKSFKKWGFMGRDVFLNKFSLKQKSLQRTGIGAIERHKILAELIQFKDRITVNDYIAACGDLISKRVAQKDLQSFSGVKCVGNTRAKFYVKELKG